MRITVVGCGYVGLVTATGLAARGHHVTGVDVSSERIAEVNSGKAPFFEPGLDDMLKDALQSGSFIATTEFGSVSRSQVILFCVGTPSGSDGSIDLTWLKQAVSSAVEHLKESDFYQVVAIRSTVVSGTAQNVVWPLLEPLLSTRKASLGLVSNPEFLREGSAAAEFFQPDRIIVGEKDYSSGDLFSQVYAGFNAPIMRMNLQTAEMVKYTSNTLWATLVSFSNEIARICETLPGVDAERVLEGVRVDRRISPFVDGKRVVAEVGSYLRAGCGYGGSCLPKDLRALIQFARARGVRPMLLEAVDEVNVTQASHFIGLAEGALGDLKSKRSLVLGVSFKTGTDDIRESPGVRLIRQLMSKGADVYAYDPLVTKSQIDVLSKEGVRFVEEPRSAAMDMDVCFVTTLAPDFAFLEEMPASLGKVLRGPLIVDGRGALRHVAISRCDRYVGIGLGPTLKFN